MSSDSNVLRIRKTRGTEGGHKPDFYEPRKVQGLEYHAGYHEELLRFALPWIMSVNSAGVSEGILPKPGGSSYSLGGLVQYLLLTGISREGTIRPRDSKLTGRQLHAVLSRHLGSLMVAVLYVV